MLQTSYYHPPLASPIAQVTISSVPVVIVEMVVAAVVVAVVVVVVVVAVVVGVVVGVVVARKGTPFIHEMVRISAIS